jgi:hypothetical protein
METTSKYFDNVSKNEKIEETCLLTYICDNTDGVLDPLDQITYGMNEVLVTYGQVVVLKDAP